MIIPAGKGGIKRRRGIPLDAHSVLGRGLGWRDVAKSFGGKKREKGPEKNSGKAF
jgi:hypothetical protein